jgi:tetratricopeptide (TPR) repeat protein
MLADADGAEKFEDKRTKCVHAFQHFRTNKEAMNVDDAYGLGRRLLELEEIKQAVETFQFVVTKLPNSNDARLSLGIAQLHLGTHVDAVAAAKTLSYALQLRFKSNDRVSIARYMYAEALRGSYDYDQSLSIYENIISTKSNVTSDKEVLQDVVTSYFSACQAADFPPKLDLVRLACSRIKTFRCYENLAGWYMRTNKEKKGRKYFKKALKLAGGKMRAYYREESVEFPTGESFPDGEMLVANEVREFEDFLTVEESDKLADIVDFSIDGASTSRRRICYASGAAPPQTRKYLVKDPTKQGYDCINKTLDVGDRLASDIVTSSSVFVDSNDIDIVKDIEHRIYESFGLSSADAWPTQLLKYPPGVSYAAHTDCTLEKLDPFDRSFTVLIYLNRIRSGGETTFPTLGRSVEPVRGKAVVFSSVDSRGFCNPKLLHVGEAVTGLKPKYVLQKWFRRPNLHRRRRSEKAYFGFHRELKSTKTPRILCDLSKSCREYVPLDHGIPGKVWEEL